MKVENLDASIIAFVERGKGSDPLESRRLEPRPEGAVAVVDPWVGHGNAHAARDVDESLIEVKRDALALAVWHASEKELGVLCL